MSKNKHLKKINKNKGLKKGGKILGVGRDGCVIDPPILCSTNSNKSDYTNQVSKVIDIHNADSRSVEEFVNEFISGDLFRQFDPKGENFLPGLEMCYKKQHELTAEQKEDMRDCKYNDHPFRSLYINILLKKGFSFQKTTATLNSDDFLKSLAYILLGVQMCVNDLGILLLDIKADNLLYSEDKDGKFPVFIDFSNDFVITDQSRLVSFLSSFNQYYDTWTLEMMIFFIQVMVGKKNKKGIKSLKKDILNQRGIDLDDPANKKYMKDITKDILKNIVLSNSKSAKHKKDINMFKEKQMCYAIGRVYMNAYQKKISKTPSFKNKKIEYILDNLQTESYHHRFMAEDALYYIQKLVPLNGRKNFLIKSKSRVRASISSSRLSGLDSMMRSLNLSQTPSTLNIQSLPSQLVRTPTPTPTPPGPPGLPPKPWLNKKNLKKNKKAKSKSISYNLKDITPRKLKKMKKPALVQILKKYKKKNCKKISGLKKAEIIDRIKLFQPKLSKKDLKSHSLLTLKRILKTHIDTKCKVKQGDKKKVLHDFILKNIV
jgi:hypothetical protein